MVEATTLAVKLVGFGRTGMTALERYLNPTAHFVAVRDQMDDEWFVEVVQLIREHAQRLSALEQERVRQRVLEDVEAVGVLAGYARAAHEEPMRERLRMLAYAAASIANMELAVGQHARIQRVLRELDAEDVLVLYGLWLTRAGKRTEHCERFRAWERSHAEALLASGCVRVDVKDENKLGVATFQTVDVTLTGTLVLRALSAFIRSKGAPEELARHEVESFLTHEQAIALLDSIPGLVNAVRRRRAAGFEGFAKYTGAGEPNDNGTLELTLNEAQFQEFHQVLPAEAPSGNAHKSPGRMSDGRTLVHFTSSSRGRYFSVINGPHEIMRQIAYEMDARWE